MIHSFVFDKNGHVQADLSADDLIKALRDDKNLVWVDLEEATREENEVLTDIFHFHPLAIEDCLNISHHPKIDTFDDYLFLVMHAVNFTSREKELSTLELNLFFGRNYVVTYHARPIRSVIQTKEKCHRDPESIMGKGADFLVYSILDAVADNFIPTLNALDYRVDQVEDDIFRDETNVLSKIIDIRNDIIYLRKIAGPERNIINQLSRGNCSFVHKDNEIYFRDIYDQLFRITEKSDGYRDMINGLLDTHLSLTSHKMNQIMKTLTIVCTIIMPLTLITGIYGMNFRNMPELTHPYGYFGILLVMLLISLGLVFYMKRKRWF